MLPIVPRTSPATGWSLTFSRVVSTVTSEESVLGSGRSVVTNGSFNCTGPVAERNTFCQMPVSRSRTASSQSQPMVDRNVGPSSAVMPPFWPTPLRSVCSCGTPGCGSGVMSTATTAGWPGVTCAVTSKMPRINAPRIVPDLRAIHPDFRGVVDAVKVEPHMAILVSARNANNRPVPIRSVNKALGNDFGALVFTVERLGIDVIVDQRRQNRAGNGGRDTSRWCRSRRRDLRARLAALSPRPATASLSRALQAAEALTAATASRRKPTEIETRAEIRQRAVQTILQQRRATSFG